MGNSVRVLSAYYLGAAALKFCLPNQVPTQIARNRRKSYFLRIPPIFSGFNYSKIGGIENNSSFLLHLHCFFMSYRSFAACFDGKQNIFPAKNRRIIKKFENSPIHAIVTQ